MVPKTSSITTHYHLVSVDIVPASKVLEFLYSNFFLFFSSEMEAGKDQVSGVTAAVAIAVVSTEKLQ